MTQVAEIADVIAAQEYPAAFAGQSIADMHSVRDLAFGEIWGIVQMAQSCTLAIQVRHGEKGPNDHSLSLDDLRMWLMYAVEHPSRKKGKPTVNVDEMVERWIPLIRGLATAHDKATVDQCEFDMETHLVPMVSAPVKQLREFYDKLVERLKADATIPFFVWKSFQVWGDVILKQASDTSVRTLKKELAGEIADLVEKHVAPDLGKAIAGALQWRDPKTLEAIKGAVEQGAKPRLVGRESCLFLQVETPDGRTETVML